MRAGGTTGIPTSAFKSPAQVAALLATIQAHIQTNKVVASAKT
jgi:hypothetical protein